MSNHRSPISDSEMERRWSQARGAMAALGVDALVMQNTSDWVGGYVRWFTDVPATNGYPRTVIFYADRPMDIIEMGPFDVVRTDLEDNRFYRGVGRVLHTPSFVSVSYTNTYDAELLVAQLRRSGVKRVGVLTPAAMPFSLINAMRTDLFDVELVDASDALDAVKATKSDEEIALIADVARLQDQVFASVCNMIRPGLSDIDIVNAAQAEAHRLGSDQGIFLGSSAPIGVAARFMSRGAQGRILDQGEHFSLLIEVNGPSGLYTEIARTIVLGSAPAALKESFALMQEAQDHTLSLLKPGTPAATIATAHDEWMRRHGLPPETRLYAHGQGVDMVERPLIRHDETMTVETGMCLAVHPGYDDGTVFAVICDNYMIGEDGPGRCLHETEKKIFEV